MVHGPRRADQAPNAFQSHAALGFSGPLTPRRFLITGLPRLRSAWLAALFSGDGVVTYHDVHVYPGSLYRALRPQGAATIGICDPSAASVWPEDALREFEGCPVVFVNRQHTAQSLSHWGPGITDAVMAFWYENAKQFLKRSQCLTVDYAGLDVNETVAQVYRFCTGRELSQQKLTLFQTLNIQQKKYKQ